MQIPIAISRISYYVRDNYERDIIRGRRTLIACIHFLGIIMPLDLFRIYHIFSFFFYTVYSRKKKKKNNIKFWNITYSGYIYRTMSSRPRRKRGGNKKSLISKLPFPYMDVCLLTSVRNPFVKSEFH